MYAAPEESLEPAGAVTKNNRRSIANGRQSSSPQECSHRHYPCEGEREREGAERRERETKIPRSVDVFMPSPELQMPSHTPVFCRVSVVS